MNQQRNSNEAQVARIYVTVQQFTERHPAFTIGGIRSLIFNEVANGLATSGAIIRIGRKILIEETAFFHWLAEQNQCKVKPSLGAAY